MGIEGGERAGPGAFFHLVRAQHVKGGGDRLISKFAEAQHGVVARRQLLARGLTREAIQVRIEGCRLLPVHRGVYAVGHRRLTQRGRWMAATLALGEGAVLSHRSAAALWGLLDDSGPIDVSSPRNARRRKGIAVHRIPSLAAPQCTKRDGVPCTTVARTLLDLAATARAATVRRAVREAEFRRMFDLRAIEAVEGHRGRRRLRAVLEGLSIGSTIRVRGATYLADFLWRDSRLVVETNGFDAHARESSFYADSRRALRLRNAGFDVLTFTWSDVMRAPADVVAAVRARV